MLSYNYCWNCYSIFFWKLAEYFEIIAPCRDLTDFLIVKRKGAQSFGKMKIYIGYFKYKRKTEILRFTKKMYKPNWRLFSDLFLIISEGLIKSPKACWWNLKIIRVIWRLRSAVSEFLTLSFFHKQVFNTIFWWYESSVSIILIMWKYWTVLKNCSIFSHALV